MIHRDIFKSICLYADCVLSFYPFCNFAGMNKKENENVSCLTLSLLTFVTRFSCVGCRWLTNRKNDTKSMDSISCCCICSFRNTHTHTPHHNIINRLFLIITYTLSSNATEFCVINYLPTLGYFTLNFLVFRKKYSSVCDETSPDVLLP